MTVCVAVICANNMVCGVSDRMLTAGNVQFQPSSSKIWLFTSSIAMMSAGDVGTQTEIYNDVMKEVTSRLSANSQTWLRVEEVVEFYRLAYFRLQRRRAERAILEPLGLDSDTFLARQASMGPEFVSKIGAELINYRMPDTAAIITGTNPELSVDPTSKDTSAHMFAIENGRISCTDKVGFACVGAGAWHANSTMMQAGHTPRTQIPKALLSMYTAKKRSEVAPGVGTETDFFVIYGLGGYAPLRSEIVDALQRAYEANIKETNQSLERAEKSLNEFIDELVTPAKPTVDFPRFDGQFILHRLEGSL
jgi:hypothetical protein